MNKLGKVLLVTLFLTFIFVIGIYLFLSPNQVKSEIENRNLAQHPELSIDKIKSGEFMKDFESYFTDQFPGRNVWLNMYIDWQRYSNQTYIFDYYVSEDNWILPKPSNSFPKEKIEIATDKVNELGKYLYSNSTDLFYVSVPHKVTTLETIYPSYLGDTSYNKKNDYFLSKLDEKYMHIVDGGSYFKNKDIEKVKQYYFQTDHHWNMKGAFEFYKYMIDSIGKTTDEIKLNMQDNLFQQKSYNQTCIPSNKFFMGSYNRQIYGSIKSNDSNQMCVYLNDAFEEYEVFLNDEKVEPYEIYASGMTDYKDKNNIYYGNIFSNDERLLTVKNNNNSEKSGNVLVIKDSYTNALVYHIAQNFHKVTYYDLRHNEDRSLIDFIKNNNFDAVLIIYNNTQLTGSMFDFFK